MTERAQMRNGTDIMDADALTAGEDRAVSQPALVEPLRRWDPEQVGGYTLLGRLGAGAMGQVYLGRSTAGRLVAVKTIKAELADEPDFRTRFGQEVAAARRVSGAFTAAVVAADSEADIPWLATVYVPAPSLAQLVRASGALPVPAVRWLAAGCAEALDSIHGAGLVHRDLKPSNVLVSPDGPRVIDFGVARAAERIALTVTRGGVGTPAYMAPEQARDTRQATSASDIFALGATMLFAATGHPPYQGETVMDVLVRLATGPPDLGGLPAELTDVVAPCLERDPRNRPSSAALLARLAPGLAVGGHDRAPLPARALALIEEYRTLAHAPLTSGPAESGAAAEAADATIGSQPGLASAPPPGGSHASRDRRPGGQPRDRGRRWPPPAARPAALALAAVALVAVSWVVGRVTANAGSPHGRPAASSSSGNTGSPRTGQTPRLGPVIAGPPPNGSGGGQNPPGTAPFQSLSNATPGIPAIGVSQPTGDGDTVFVIRGQWWPIGQPVTVTLVGLGASPVHPIADHGGSFNYAVNQGHEFFAGAMPAGIYTLRVSDAAGASAQAKFEVT
jgi:serine/threonine protein kinase